MSNGEAEHSPAEKTEKTELAERKPLTQKSGDVEKAPGIVYAPLETNRAQVRKPSRAIDFFFNKGLPPRARGLAGAYNNGEGTFHIMDSQSHGHKETNNHSHLHTPSHNYATAYI